METRMKRMKRIFTDKNLRLSVKSAKSAFPLINILALAK